MRRFQRDPAQVSREALAFLTKAAKGIKGGIDPKALHEALPLIGWSIQDIVVTVPADGEKVMTKQMREALQKNDTFYRDSYFSGRSGQEKSVYMKDEASAKSLLRDMRAIVTETSGKKPPVAQLGEIILRNLRIHQEEPHWSKTEQDLRWLVSFSDSWMGLPGWRVTTPQGGEVIFTPKNDRGRLEPIQEKGSDRFWSFAYKSGLKELAKGFIESMGAEVVQAVLKPVDPRTLINTGTCPVCFQNIKLTQGRIMRHGWAVAGRRQRGVLGLTVHTGPCFGVGYEPFEVSPQGTKDYLKIQLIPRIQKTKKDIAYLQTEPILSVQVPMTYKEPSRIEKIDRTDPRYERLLESELDLATHMLKALERERNTLEERVREWKPRPLYTPPSARDRAFGRARPRYSRSRRS